MTIKETLNSIVKELEDPSLNKQRKRYLESYLKDLQEYHDNNPQEEIVPTPLELYCDLNPEASECRIYDD
jgi:hypothetical protein